MNPFDEYLRYESRRQFLGRGVNAVGIPLDRDGMRMDALAAALDDLKRRMQSAQATLKHELNGLRTGRASASLLEPVHVEAYGQRTPLNQVASISVPPGSRISSGVTMPLTVW